MPSSSPLSRSSELVVNEWRCPECGSRYTADIGKCGQRQPWHCEGTVVPIYQSVHERIAAAFHDEYEERAPLMGYKTRDASAVPWPEVPEQNRRLMEATVAALLRRGIIDVGPEA